MSLNLHFNYGGNLEKNCFWPIKKANIYYAVIIYVYYSLAIQTIPQIPTWWLIRLCLMIDLFIDKLETALYLAKARADSHALQT